MKFLYPGFLFALFAIAIPILIHLFSFRRYTTVYFSNVEYLRNIKKESRNKRQLKHLLMLLARILTIISLVFAFAQPYIPSENQQKSTENQVVTVYIDNSFSMNALSTGGQLLEVARNKALEIAGAYPAGTSFRLITNDLHPRHQHLFNKEQFMQQVSEIRSSSRTVNLSQIHNRISPGYTYPAGKRGNTNYFISDFQSRVTDLHNFVPDSQFFNYFIPLKAEVTANLSVDSCWMELPAHKLGQEEHMRVKIINYSDEAYQNLPVRLFLNDTVKALANFSIDPGGEQVIDLKYLNFSRGVQLGKVEISDFPIIHDNTYFLNYTVQDQIRTLVIYSNSFRGNSGLPWMRALLSGDEFISYEEMAVENLAISRLSEFNSIILMNIHGISTGLMTELTRLAHGGTSILFFPEPDGDTSSYNEFLLRFNASAIERFDTTTQAIGGIEWNHPVFSLAFRERTSDVDFPVIAGRFIFSSRIKVAETPVLWFRDGTKALSVQPFGNGNLAVSAFPLSGLNQKFTRHVLFVPTLYGLVMNSLPFQKLAYTIGQDSHASLLAGEDYNLNTLKIRTDNQQQPFIPSTSPTEERKIRIDLTTSFESAGHYEVLSDDTMLTAISMNYDRRESSPSFMSYDELITESERLNLENFRIVQNQDSSFSEVFDEMNHGRKLWKWFVLLALLFIFSEAMISRLIK